MLFGVQLLNEIFPPWKSHYVDYERLKKLLKENVVPRKQWTETEESAFVKALDQELDKVYLFQRLEYDAIEKQVDQLEARMLVLEGQKFDVEQFTADLEHALTSSQHLDRFARINFTGFVKIVKKHDRLHLPFNVLPLLNVRLKELLFHSEDYLPLLYKLSGMYNFLRENYLVGTQLSKLLSFKDLDKMNFKLLKFWIHPDNLMEVKATVLRHLPVLVYNNLDEDGELVDEDDEDDKNDPTITTLYLDLPGFELYNKSLGKDLLLKLLRLRWTGRLADKPSIFLEEKIQNEQNELIDTKLEVKEKYLNLLIVNNDFPVAKFAAKMQRRHALKSDVDGYVATVEKLSHLVHDNHLQPIVRAVYKRTAFQIPGNDRVRVLVDLDILFIREDSFDEARPIRDPLQWHRTDIDSKVADPYLLLRKNESSKFPYTLMEIQVHNPLHMPQWVSDLVELPLVKQVPQFSKYVHGVAMLFAEDDHLDKLPFWILDLDQDIRQVQALHEQPRSGSVTAHASGGLDDADLDMPRTRGTADDDDLDFSSDEDFEEEVAEAEGASSTTPLLVPRRLVLHPNRPLYLTRSRREYGNKLLGVELEDEEVTLPVGVKTPTQWIKNLGPLKIEPKVWLANERTLNRWLHVTALFSGLTFVIYNGVRKAHFPELATVLAYFYFALLLFTMAWGWYIYNKRLQWIRERGSKHLDGPVGPVVVGVGLVVALTVNFVALLHRLASQPHVDEWLDAMHPVQRSVQVMAFKAVGASTV